MYTLLYIYITLLYQEYILTFFMTPAKASVYSRLYERFLMWNVHLERRNHWDCALFGDAAIHSQCHVRYLFFHGCPWIF